LPSCSWREARRNRSRTSGVLLFYDALYGRHSVEGGPGVCGVRRPGDLCLRPGRPGCAIGKSQRRRAEGHERTEQSCSTRGIHDSAGRTADPDRCRKRQREGSVPVLEATVHTHTGRRSPRRRLQRRQGAAQTRLREDVLRCYRQDGGVSEGRGHPKRESVRRRERASAAELHEGLRVSADYTGYDVAESYPSQTAARVVTILGSR
jgi:hypothetical protein